LTFTLKSVDLQSSPLDPPDALEIALLRAADKTSLVGTNQGLSQSDGFLNLNADREVFFGAQTSVSGVTTSGSEVTLQFPLTIEVDVSAVAAGTQAILFVELLGAGPLGATVTIDDVMLRGDIAPSLSLVIDPATDSGLVGDAYTNFALVNLVGTTESGQVVQMDVDGDGFDDGDATAGADGRFRFANVAFATGSNEIRVQATNPHGTNQLARTFVFDNSAATGQLVSPQIGSIVAQDQGFVELQWTDNGASGLDPSSFDRSDIQVTGVTVDRIEVLPAGRVRYWYSDDGNTIPHGLVRVTQVAGQVRDRAGNGLAAKTDEFSRLRTTCPWNNPLMNVDVDRDGVIAPIDLLLIINRLNEQGAGRLPIPTSPPNVPPPFHDTNCDDFVSPIDALLVINWINEQSAISSQRPRVTGTSG